jgi:hypothetical protein
LPIPLAVTVTDAGDNPVAGALVTFAAPARGPSGFFTTRVPMGKQATKNTKRKPSTRHTRIVRVRTNNDGVAVAPPFTANALAGGYVVTATVASRRTAFALVNTPAS